MSSEADLSQSPKPDATLFSLRPQRPVKKTVASGSTSGAATMDAETPTTVKSKSGQPWRSGGAANTGPTPSSSSRDGREHQHRERRGSSGPRIGRSGSGSMANSSSFPSVNGAGSSSGSGGKPRSGNGNVPHITPIAPRKEDEPSDLGSPSQRRDPASSRTGPKFLANRSESSRFYAELTGLFNKLTIEKFETISTMIAMKFETIETLEVLTESIKLLHTKPLLEHSFSGMYADLIKILDRPYPFESLEPISAPSTPPPQASSSTLPISITSATSRVEQIRSDALSASPLSSSPDRSVSPARHRSDSSGTGKPRPIGMLRKVLLNQCYYVWQEAVDGTLQLIGEDEVTLKARYRVNGNMIFMGELFKRGLMPLKILKSSADGMISMIREKTAKYSPELSASVEPHCVMLFHLLRTVGEFLDKDRQGKPLLDGYMDAMKDFAANKSFQQRVRLLIRDVIDDRLNDWRPRRRFEGPMKLEDLKELHEADMINPIHPTSDRIYVPSSEYDERYKQRGYISPSLLSPSGSTASGLQAGSSSTASGSTSGGSTSTSTGRRGKDRSGSGTSNTGGGSRRSGSGGTSFIPFPTTIKEPISFGNASGASSSSNPPNSPNSTSSTMAQAGSFSISTSSSSSSVSAVNSSAAASSSPSSSNPVPGATSSDLVGGLSGITINIRNSSNSQLITILPFPKQLVVSALNDEEFASRPSGSSATMSATSSAESYDSMEENLESFLYQHASYRSSFVNDLFNWILDRSKQQQALVSSLLARLVRSGVLSAEEIVTGLSTLLQNLEDLVMDVPQAPSLLGLRVRELSTQLSIISDDQVQTLLRHCPTRCLEKFRVAINSTQ